MTADDHQQIPKLIAALSDGSINADQLDQLNQQLLTDPIDIEVYLDHMELDAMLEREFDGQVNVRQEPTLKTKPKTSLARRVAVAAIALAGLLTVGIFVNDSFRPPSELATDLPVVVNVAGDVRVGEDTSAATPIVVGQRLESGTAVRTEGGEVVLRYDDGTHFTLTGTSTLELRDATRPGKQLHLQRGVLFAEVAQQPDDRPVVITTPHTQVCVLGTRFELTASDEAGTRLDLESGQVELVRENEKPVLVKPNSIAVIRSAEEPIRIAPRPTIIAAPDREAQFPGVYAIDFSSDGRTVIATTRRGAVYWQSNDEIETERAIDQDDMKVVTQAGSLVVFEEKEPRRLVFWDAAAREVVRIVDQLDQLPEVFNVVAKVAGKKSKMPFPSVRINALSPRGDWIAVHSRVKGKDTLHLFDLAKDKSWIIERDCLMMNFRTSPDGSLVAIGQSRGGLKNSGTIELISADSGEHIMLLTVLEAAENQRPGIVQSQFEFSPDGRHLVVAIRGRLQVWDLTTGERMANIEDAGDVRQVAISGSAKWVAGVRPKSPIQLWNVTEPQKSLLLEPGGNAQALMFSPEGQEVVALLKGGQLRVWNFALQATPIDERP